MADRGADLPHNIPGATWQPVPGYKSDHGPVETNEGGKKSEREDEDDDSVYYQLIPMGEDEQVEHATGTYKSKVAAVRVPHGDVERYDTTPNCPACKYLAGGRGLPLERAIPEVV